VPTLRAKGLAMVIVGGFITATALTLLILPAVYHVVEKRVAATASGVSGQKYFARTRSGLRVSQRAENSIEAAGVRRTHVRISYCKIAQVGLYVES